MIICTACGHEHEGACLYLLVRGAIQEHCLCEGPDEPLPTDAGDPDAAEMRA
jgi:hypothetical protein